MPNQNKVVKQYKPQGQLVESMDSLAKRFPTVEATVMQLGGRRTFLLVRSDAVFVLAWDILGLPYKLKIESLKDMRAVRGWEFFMEGDDITFNGPSGVYPLGPWTKKDPSWVLGSLSSCCPHRRKKVGEGKNALDLPLRGGEESCL